MKIEQEFLEKIDERERGPANIIEDQNCFRLLSILITISID